MNSLQCFVNICIFSSVTISCTKSYGICVKSSLAKQCFGVTLVLVGQVFTTQCKLTEPVQLMHVYIHVVSPTLHALICCMINYVNLPWQSYYFTISFLSCVFLENAGDGSKSTHPIDSATVPKRSKSQKRKSFSQPVETEFEKLDQKVYYKSILPKYVRLSKICKSSSQITIPSN